jgi:hypothetical protein
MGCKAVRQSKLPQRLSTIERYRAADAVNPDNPKRFQLLMRNYFVEKGDIA